jgi:hypothetical protein
MARIVIRGNAAALDTTTGSFKHETKSADIVPQIQT